MPDNIERTIYKLEIDDSGYIRGVDAMAASTAKFTKEQEQANATLKTNEAALKVNTDRLNKAKKDLEDYAGTNARYRKQLEGDVKSAEKDQQQLTELVDKNRIAYEEATKAASDFVTISAKASQVQQPTGKIPVPSPVPQPQLAAGLQDALSQISLGDLPETLGKVLPEFEELRRVIGLAEEKMKSLNAEDEEFKQLEPIVTKGKEALQLYDEATKKTTGSQQSLRSQLRQAREDLVRLEQAGKGATKEYFELEKQTAKLTDEFRDQQERIKILSSDTKALDFGKGAITGATAAFQAYTSVAILAGDESAELQKKTMQLFAAMQLLQSIEQLSNLTRREGVLATLAQSAAQSVYTAVVGASTGALKAFRIALLATGIGAAVVTIGLLVKYFNDLKKAQEEATRQTKLFNEVQQETNKQAGAEIANLEILYKVATNTTLSLKKRKEAVDDLQKQYPDYFKNINDEIILQGKAADAYDATKAAIIEAARTRAINSKLEELATKELDAIQEKNDVKQKQRENDARKRKADASKKDAEARGLEQFSAIAEGGKLINAEDGINKKLADIAQDRDFVLSQITTPETKVGGGGGGGGATKTAPENVYEQERQKQKERLAELLRKSVEDEKTIRAQFEEQLKAEVLRINNLLKDKKLTRPQAATLKLEAAKINTVELDKALVDFNKKVTDARKKLNDEIRALQNKAIQDSINLIQDEFERRKEIIDFNEQKEIQDAKDNTTERLASLELDKLLIGEEAYQKDRADIVNNGEQAILNITGKYANERQGLAADIFKRSLDVTQQILDEQLTQLDENTAEKIKAQKALLDSGAINYEQFQKALTKIQKDEKAERDRVRLEELRAELKAINDRLKATKDAAEKEQLQARQRSVRGQIAEIESKVDTTDPNTTKKEQLTAYVDSIGQLTDSVIQFWAKANEAEQKALDRSIDIQQKRVDAAQRIADRGNAQYLKQEEDRLRELEIKRENAARRQLGIDAALQASQLLVGITGAIAKISTGIGAAETIAEIAVIVGALATGYGLVKSLQGNQPRLFVGTTDTGPGKNADDKGGFHAILHPHEAVIPADKNRKYKPTVEAIYHGKVPAEAINTFVSNYNKNFVSTHIDSIPRVNTEKIKHTAETNISHDGKLAAIVGDQNRLLSENNDLQRQTLRAMKSMSVSANIDRNGVAIMVNEYIEQMNIDKRV
jgi:hypothetical protein